MYIPEEKVSDIIAASDIVEIISDFVMLKKSGMNYFGLCPFHSEKTPSFSVSPHKQMFHCFGCGAGGNAVSFIMKYQGISFVEAVKFLAEKCGIEIDTGPVNPEKQQRMALREGLFRINTRVTELYRRELKKGSGAEDARKYLQKRSISQDTIDKFSIGYAPDAWNTVVNFLRKMRVSRTSALECGLVLTRKNKDGYYDRFRNRIIFPIYDINMQITGFGGRVMDDAMPKYLNSPETSIYSKGKILYGLHRSRQHCRRKGGVYIVEGYFDFLSLYQRGIKNCVASLGTALTSDHVRLLKGYASKMVLVFDSDNAGINAAKRSIDTFMKDGVDVRILVLPEGYDPDSFVVENGKDAFIGAAEKAMSVMDFLRKTAEQKHGFSLEGKIAILNEMKEYLSVIEDSALRSLYIRELSQWLGIDEKAVLEKVRSACILAAKNTGRREVNARDISCTAPPQDALPEACLKSDRRECQMLSMMIQYPEIIPEVQKKGVLDCFYSNNLKSLGELIISKLGSSGGQIGELMVAAADKNHRELIAELSMKDVTETEDVFTKSLFLINRIIKIRKKNEGFLINEIRRAEQDGNSDLPLDLLQKRQSEIRKLHGYK